MHSLFGQGRTQAVVFYRGHVSGGRRLFRFHVTDLGLFAGLSCAAEAFTPVFRGPTRHRRLSGICTSSLIAGNHGFSSSCREQRLLFLLAEPQSVRLEDTPLGQHSGGRETVLGAFC
jgi:hypothetical protein